MRDTADRLAQGVRDLIKKAVREAVERESLTPLTRAAERPKVYEDHQTSSSSGSSSSASGSSRIN